MGAQRECGCLKTNVAVGMSQGWTSKVRCVTTDTGRGGGRRKEKVETETEKKKIDKKKKKIRSNIENARIKG